MSFDVQYQTADRLIVAYGTFPDGSPDPSTVGVATLDDAERSKIAEPGLKYLETDETIRVEPPPPPPPSFTVGESSERLTLIHERAAEDPAYAALAAEMGVI